MVEGIYGRCGFDLRVSGSNEFFCLRVAPALSREKGLGWGTWIRTRTNGVRVRGSTVNLFPSNRAGAFASACPAGEAGFSLRSEIVKLLAPSRADGMPAPIAAAEFRRGTSSRPAPPLPHIRGTTAFPRGGKRPISAAHAG